MAEIRFNVCESEFVLPAQRFRDPPFNRERADLAWRPSSSQALRTLVMGVAERAGISADIHPHLLRRAYADHVARFAGIRNAQFLLGHAGIATTEIYVGRPTPDELVEALDGFSFGTEDRTDVLGIPQTAHEPSKATTGIEPV